MGLIFALLAGGVLALPGCSKQGEGERCSPIANGSDDCEEGLTCKAVDKTSKEDFGRCCPPDLAEISDSRCNFTTITTSTGGTSSTGGATSGGNASGGSSSGGTSSTGGASGGSDNSSGGTPDSGEGGSGATSGAGDTAGASGSNGG